MPNWTLMTWGSISFQVFPLNYDEMNHNTASDWARKEIAGAAVYREWVGENDEEIQLRGKVFPYFFAAHKRQRINRGTVLQTPTDDSGLSHLDVMDNMRRLGQAHALTTGDGWHLGWFVIEKLTRAHTHIGVTGIGQQIQFDATFQRVPVPNDPAAYFTRFWGQAP